MSAKEFFSSLKDFIKSLESPVAPSAWDLKTELRHIRIYLNQREEAFNKLAQRVEELEQKFRQHQLIGI
jgi:hypothetical protein